MTYDVIIIGGGAAGLTAALSASGKSAKVLILESANRPGRKILATGNGRCNLVNMGKPRFYGNRQLAQSVLSRCGVKDVLSFFHDLGLVTVEEEGGRVYPGCGQAAAVLDVLRFALERKKIPLICDAPAQKIERKGNGFSVHTPAGVYQGKTVIAACGGMAGGKLGHDGSAYRLLTDLGHGLVSPQPALTQLNGDKQAVKGLSGLRLPARLTLCDDKKPLSASQGEVLFTDYGVSGVCAMQLSRDAQQLLKKGKRPMLYLDFSPVLGLSDRIYDRVKAEDPFRNQGKIQAFLEKRTHILPRDALLTGLLPRLLAQKLQGCSLPEMARLLGAYPVEITGVRGFEHAQVTQGGLDGRAFDPETLESRMCPGLYAAGEMLDVDGDCGGYNLLFAFASGLIAGEEAALHE